ncbi:MAG TPA: hypothetical protein VKE51_12195 [Vicinamibacterales bacterium]|nr:hypothetical protein [Vicinamibacterales bacterium]
MNHALEWTGDRLALVTGSSRGIGSAVAARLIERFSVRSFRDFAASGALVPPSAPASEIVSFLESDDQPRFAERRLNRPAST